MARYCTYCGEELRAGAKFCGNCGAPVEERQETQDTKSAATTASSPTNQTTSGTQRTQHQQAPVATNRLRSRTVYPTETFEKKLWRCIKVFSIIFIVLFVLAGFSYLFIGPSGGDDKVMAENQLFDVNSYALITPEQLIERAGEPASIDEAYNFTAASGEYIEGVMYYYPGLNSEFLFIDGQLAQISTYGKEEGVQIGVDKIIQVEDEEDIFTLFGLNREDGTWTEVFNNGYAIRYTGSGAVTELWVVDIANGTFYVAKIRFTDDLLS